MKKKLPTIKDVARVAGVSISTVSAVMNANKPVSPELRKRVEQASEQLDFHPNQQARSLNRKTSRTLAYLTPDIGNAGFLRIFDHVTRVANKRGYSMVLVDASGTPDDVQSALKKIVELRVDGAFLTMSWSIVRLAEDIDRLARRGIHAAGIAGSWPIAGRDCYLWDEREAGEQLGRYLSQIGHQQVLFLAPDQSRSSELRQQGLLSGLSDRGPQARLIAQRTSNYSPDAGYQALQAAIAEARGFSAVVCFNDAIAVGALAALHDHGLNVPDNVSLATFGDSLQEFTRPRVTSVTFNEEVMAKDCANRLIDRIEGIETSEPENHFYRMQLAIKASTDLPRTFHPAAIGASTVSDTPYGAG
ncbi:MAG: hypothetical protein CML24_09310 [Rhizobiales bacterium]|nr:hypothetical protein [Hyphomicrobiales bacterium]|tara:strand:+ start:8469 stop:9548 length:1080 start_codon:yes stop_codon:yes gene_type:complete